METIIKKSIEGGYIIRRTHSFYSFEDNGENIKVPLTSVILDPLFWQALFRNKTEALIPRQKFFSILFGDEGGDEGWNKAVAYLSDLIK